MQSTSDHKDWFGSALCDEGLADSDGLLRSTWRTGLTMLARREVLADLEAGEPLVGALLTSPTICFHAAMAAYRTRG